MKEGEKRKIHRRGAEGAEKGVRREGEGEKRKIHRRGAEGAEKGVKCEAWYGRGQWRGERL